MRVKDGVVFALVAAITMVMLAPLLDAGFLTDDFHIIRICTIGLDLQDGWSFHNIREVFHYFVVEASPFVQLYRPSVLVSFGANVLSTGLDPFYFQLTNLLLHLGAGFTVFSLARTLAPRAGSVFVGCTVLLFLISPVQLEVAAWSAARSETLSLIFGGWALILKIKDRRRIWGPAVLAILALTSKESALAFLALLILVDVKPVFVERDQNGQRLQALGRSLVLVALLGVYLGTRRVIFNQVFGVYTNTSVVDDFDFTRLLHHILKTLAVFLAPVSEIIKTPLLARVPGIGLCMMGWSGLVSQICTRLPQHWIPRVLLALLMFLLTLGMSVMVNPANMSLVASRSLYTPLAAVVLLLVLGGACSKGLFRWLPILSLLTVALTLCRASQAPHIAAAREVRTVLESIWSPIRELEQPPFTRLAILGYREKYYFNQSFHMAAALPVAVKTPFLAKDLTLVKIGTHTIDGGEIRSFEELASDTSPDLGIFWMKEDPTTGNRRCELVYGGSKLSAKGQTLELKAPANQAEIVLDLGSEGAQEAHFDIHTEGFEPATIELTVFTGERVLPRLRSAAAPLQVENGRYRVTIPASALPNIATEREPYGWFVSSFDADGREIARSHLSYFFATLRPKR